MRVELVNQINRLTSFMEVPCQDKKKKKKKKPSVYIDLNHFMGETLLSAGELDCVLVQRSFID